MSARVGVGISRDSVRAVLVRRGAVIWSASTAVGEEESIRDALGRVLGGLPRSRWLRPGVAVAIGPAAAQVKRLAGVPALADRVALAELVATNAGRFFLRNGIPLRLTEVHVPAAGEVWAGAVEAPVLDNVADACRALRLRLDAAYPAVAVLGYGSPASDGTVVWRDADTCAEAEFRDRTLVGTRRLPAPAGDKTLPATAVHPALAALGDAAADFADAYGVAVAPRRSQLAVRSADGRASGAAAHARLAVLVVLLMASAAAVLFAPGLAASREADRARSRVAELDAVARHVARMRQANAQLSSALEQVADFGVRRRSMTGLLGALSVATPDSTAIVTLRVDSAGGQFTALAPRGAAVLTSLGDVGEIAGASIFGSVTRELVGAQELERVAIRFRAAPRRLPSLRIPPPRP